MLRRLLAQQCPECHFNWDEVPDKENDDDHDDDDGDDECEEEDLTDNEQCAEMEEKYRASLHPVMRQKSRFTYAAPKTPTVTESA
eukprot:EC786955.1.p2 GENE.EC786955.1~~EC786955.1.p2  ORF type:complete len:85 (+),score=18.73 EC786955.1:36-290(+)